MSYLRGGVSLVRLRTLREIALTIGALLGSVCILAAIAFAGLGVKPLIFRSGSMAPAIETGALAFAESTPSSSLEVGDVVSVKADNGRRITHRITNIESHGKQATLTLKGDDNDVVDRTPYVVRSADRVLFDIPKAGYVIAWVSGPIGTFLAGLFVALMLLLGFRRPNRENDKSGTGGKRRAVNSAIVLVAGASLIGGNALVSASPTEAAFSDSAIAGSTVFSTHTVLPPNSVTCSGGGLLSSLTFTWPNKDVRYRYRVQVERPAGTILDTYFVNNNGTVSTNQSYVLTFGVLDSLLGISTTFTLRIRSELTDADEWVSATGPTDTGTFTLGVSSSC